MPKKAVTEPVQANGLDIRSIMRGAGCQRLWTARPKSQPFEMECWITANRRLVILKVNDDGPVETFEELTTATFQEAIQVISAR